MRLAACCAALAAVLVAAGGCSSDGGGSGTSGPAAPSAAPSVAATTGDFTTAAQLADRLRCTDPMSLPPTSVGAKPVADVQCASAWGPLEVVTFRTSTDVEAFLTALRGYLPAGARLALVRGPVWLVSYKAPDGTDLAAPSVTAKYRTVAADAHRLVGGTVVTLTR